MPVRVMGMETEYAISGQATGGDSLDTTRLAKDLVQLAADRLVNLPAGDNAGLFLGNGSRLYRDSGNHPELSTPECLTPWEVARYVGAGDRIMRDLAEALRQRLGAGCTVNIAKVNVDYSGSGTTWGCHESYAHRIRGAGFYDSLIPHLVSRIIYTGAGGFDSTSPGLVFTLSPRAHHLVESVSGSSTNDRGIVHTKNESLSDGSTNRLHLLCGESLFCQTPTVLKVGATALVVALLEHGTAGLDGWHLAEPVPAMRAIALDPTCRTRVHRTNGMTASALEIQNRYLDLLESELGADWLPEWAEDICRLWRKTLQRLANSPDSVQKSLDWAVKHLFFEKLARDRGFDAAGVARWNGFLDLFTGNPTRTRTGEWAEILHNLLDVERITQSLGPQADAMLRERQLNRDELPRFLELRRDLFTLDTKFNMLGGDGIFEALETAGVLRHKIPAVGDITRAMTEAPRGTRAGLRGDAIRKLSRKKGENLCGWDFVNDQARGLQLNLQDPLCLQERWEPIRPRRRSRAHYVRSVGRPNDFLNLIHGLDL